MGWDVGLLVGGGGGGVADRPAGASGASGASFGIGGRTLPLPAAAPLLGDGRFTGMATVSSR